jgi:hypothetical protein
MRQMLLVILLIFPSLSFSADWKIVAESTLCDEKIKIMGKEGEKYVMAIKGEDKIKLSSKDGSVFHENSMKSTEFSNVDRDGTKYTFFQPSYVEGNPPKIDVMINDSKKRCRMELTK